MGFSSYVAINEYFVFCGKLIFGVSRFDPFHRELTFDTQEVERAILKAINYYKRKFKESDLKPRDPNTVEPLHNGHLGDRRKWPLWRGGRYGEVGV